MKFNLNTLKGLFGKLAKSGIADDVAKFATNYGDDVALGALDVVDDIPTSIAFDDLADAYKNRIPVDKSPISPKEFVHNYKVNRENKIYGEMMDGLYPDMASQIGSLDSVLDPTDLDIPANYKLDSTPDYNTMNIDPYYYGRRHRPDSMVYPDGFEFPEDFANYYDALETGIPHRYASTAAVEEAYTGASDPHIYANITLPKDLHNSIKNFEEYGSGLYEGYDDADYKYNSHKQSLKDAVRSWLYYNYI